MDTNMAKNAGRAKLVRKHREERAWTQSHLADASRVNLRTIQRLERDGSASFETLLALAGAFEMNVKDLNPTSRTTVAITPQKKIYLMPRLTIGKEFGKLIEGADQYQFEHDEADDKRTLGCMVDLLKVLSADVVCWHDADAAERLKLEFELSQGLKEFEGVGIYLFGIKRDIPQVIGKRKTQINMCTLYLSHSRSPKIRRDKRGNMVVPAVLTEVAR